MLRDKGYKIYGTHFAAELFFHLTCGKKSIEHIYSIYTSKIEEFVLGGLEGNALDVEPLYPGSNPTFGIF